MPNAFGKPAAVFPNLKNIFIFHSVSAWEASVGHAWFTMYAHCDFSGGMVRHFRGGDFLWGHMEKVHIFL